MRRSICYCEPAFAQAGQVDTWKFAFTSSINLPKGTKLKFDLVTKGRIIDWEHPSANLKKGSNLIYLLMNGDRVVQGKEIELPQSVVPQYEFVLPKEVEAGETVTIVMGAPKQALGNAKNEQALGNRSQTHSQRRRSFHLFIDPSGKGHYDEPEVFTLDVRGGELKTIRILAPSFIARNKRFDITLRFEDEYGNLTNQAPEDTLIEVSYEHFRENLNWKLFVPETGFITLPNMYFNEPGVYTLRLHNLGTGEIFRAAPIRCFADGNKQLFWGLLHGESDRYDSTEDIENCLRHFRDEKSYNFYAVSPFESQEETPNEVWKLITQQAAEFDESERFIALTGMQWHGKNGEEGLRQLLFGKESKQIIRKKDPKYASLSKIYKSYSPKELISIPCFTMGEHTLYDFEHFDPEYERVVEIYNSWGSSECTAEEGNLFPIRPNGKKGTYANPKGSIQRALLNNHRFGFVAGGLDDRGSYADFYDGDQAQYPPGLTAIVATEQTKTALMEALYQRSCYATTGERLIVGFYLAGQSMGSEILSSDKPGLLINRHLSGYVAGTADLKQVDIIRNGKVIKTFKPEGYAFEFTYDDMEPLEKVVQSSKNKKPPFVFYYIRVIQADGHMAWSSPIWVDLMPGGVKGGAKRTLVAKPAPKRPIFEEVLSTEEEEEEDFDEDEDEDV